MGAINDMSQPQSGRGDEPKAVKSTPLPAKVDLSAVNKTVWLVKVEIHIITLYIFCIHLYLRDGIKPEGISTNLCNIVKSGNLQKFCKHL